MAEFLNGVRSSGEEFLYYHDALMSDLGVHVDSALALAHREEMSTLMHVPNYDKSDFGICACLELVARYALQRRNVARRNPKNPDYKGLELMMATSLDSKSAAHVDEFGRFVVEGQGVEAFTLKQQRLYAEEEPYARKSKKDS